MQVLNQLDDAGKTLDQLIDRFFLNHPKALKRDKALFFAITYGVLRRRNHLDWVITRLSKTPFSKIAPDVKNILRISLFQILYMDRIPASAAVNTAVNLAKSIDAPWIARYVNGMLRNAIRKHADIPLPDAGKDPVQHLAVSLSFPKWLVRRWVDRFGPEETKELCNALNEEPAITLRANTRKISRADLAVSLKGNCEKTVAARHAPAGVSIYGPKTPIDEMDAFIKGHFAVQDEAAQLATLMLAPQPGETVLDACCGRGGKTGYLAQMMDNCGHIYAVDQGKHKLTALEKEMRRLGITMVIPRVLDLQNRISSKRLPMFDRILLDAPCSGLGVIRRNPDTKWRAMPEKINTLADLQLQLLTQCAAFLKPGGTLVFVVCSMEPEENETVIGHFLDRHDQFFIQEKGKNRVAAIDPLLDEKGYLRTFPHRHQMDGFFAACLKKTG